MFLETIQAKRFARVVNLSVGADFFVAMFGSPLGDIGVKTFSVSNDGRKQKQIAALLEFGLQMLGQFIARLGFDWQLAVRTILRAESREE